VRAWNIVEQTATEKFPKSTRLMSVGRLVDLVGLNHDLRSLAVRLAKLRNQVVHAQIVPSSEAARDFVAASWKLASAVRRELGDPDPT